MSSIDQFFSPEYLARLDPLDSSRAASSIIPLDQSCRYQDYSWKPLLLLLGLPGAGKTTQAHLLLRRVGYTIISSGDIVRCALAETSTRSLAFGRCTSGGMPPPRLIGQLVIDAIVESTSRCDVTGIVVDGFPRTLSQARFLQKSLGPHFNSGTLRPLAVLFCGLTKRELLQRAVKRTVCPRCSAVYPLDERLAYPVCSTCGEVTVLRADGSEEDVLRRIKTQSRYLGAVADHFYQRRMLFPINADRSKHEINDLLLAQIERLELGS